MARHPIIEEEIQDLCSRALLASDEDAGDILAELRILLRVQIARIGDRTREVVPKLKSDLAYLGNRGQHKRLIMTAPNDKPDRQMHKKWEDIARELSTESNSERIAELAHELNEAMLGEERSKVRQKLQRTA